MSTVKRFCFWADDDAIVAHLKAQVLHGTKTATARPTFSWGIPRNVFDDARFDATPEKLWRAEAEPSAQAFRDSHVEDWPNLTLTNDAILTAIHFERLV